LDEITERDALRDGFNSIAELRKEIARIYPNIRDKDWVTIIDFHVSKLYNNAVIKDVKVMDNDMTRIAKLALAYDLGFSKDEKRVLGAVALAGNVDDALRYLSKGFDKTYVQRVVNKARTRLKSRGLI